MYPANTCDSKRKNCFVFFKKSYFFLKSLPKQMTALAMSAPLLQWAVALILCFSTMTTRTASSVKLLWFKKKSGPYFPHRASLISNDQTPKGQKVWSKDLKWDAFTEHMSTLNFGFVRALPPLRSAVRSTLARVNSGTSLCGTCTQTQITYIWAPKWNKVQPSWDKVLPYIF